MRNAQSTLRVDIRDRGHDGGTTVHLRLGGELDVTSSPLLQTVIDQVLAPRRTPMCSRLVVDMSGVSFADASGLCPLLLARAMLARRGGQVELRHCRRGVQRVLHVLGLDSMSTVDLRPTATVADQSVG